MGIDLLDISYRIEREFGVRFDLRELADRLASDTSHDPTAGELFAFLMESLDLKEPSEPPFAADCWARLQTIIAETCAIPVSRVIPTARLHADLGCE